MIKHQEKKISNELIQELVTSIYDAALDETQWESILKKLTMTIDAEQSNFRLLNVQSKNIKQVYTYNKDPYWTQSYIDYYVKKDPWLDMLATPKSVNLTCTHHLISDKEYQNLEFYHDFVVPQGIYYGIGGVIDIKKGSSCYIALQRAQKSGGFAKHHLDFLNKLAPHIQKAVLINERIQNVELQKNLFSDALNQINSALLLVNKNGKILFINEQAEHLIRNQAGVDIKDNCLFIQNLRENKNLQNLIHQATLKHINGALKQGGAMRYSSLDSSTTTSVLVTPVNPGRINQGALSDETAIVLLSVNNSPLTLTAEMLKGLYGFTTAEARLTISLCQDLTLDEIAEKQCRSKNTLRAQLRSSFKKTGVSRQAELIRLVSTGPAAEIKTR